jgi:hypothetical protein
LQFPSISVSKTHLIKLPCGKRVEAFGLSQAFHLNVFAIGFRSCDFWGNHIHQIEITNGEIKSEEIICISEQKHVGTPEVDNWFKESNQSSLARKYIALGYPKKLPFYNEENPSAETLRFQPKDNNSSAVLTSAGYEDKSGNFWKWDSLHDNHWDVQLNPNRKREEGYDYFNVSETGKILSRKTTP